MRFTIIVPAFILLCALKTLGQAADSLNPVSLPAVTIHAFEQARRLKDVPAAVSYINRQMLDNFSTSSIVSAVNTAPGIRMEERSPGSYRLNIRGSTLRSPFGVRNVKIYYNDIPFTDPGGQSYLNQLGNHTMRSIEIIKGSNNSIYGAGTGGVMLIESLSERDSAELTAGYGFGSYNLQSYHASLTTASDKMTSRYGFEFQKSDGYRVQSGLRKSVASWNGLLKTGKESLLKTTFLFGDLFYETPGALTKAEMDANPRAARPGTPAAPGAVQANAYIRQKMFLAGASYEQPVTAGLQNKTTFYGMFTELTNPNLRNYEKSAFPHFGGRTVFRFQQSFNDVLLDVDGGAEFQQAPASVNIHKNKNGNADTLVSHDEIINQQAIVFLQASLDFHDWVIITGASWNAIRLGFERFTPAASGRLSRKFNNEIAPRFSVMKKYKRVNFYASVARGFSPPATAELLPTGGAINTGLNAEEGITYDVGAKGNFFNNLYYDINLFLFSLHNTIVQRRDAAGGDFFINAGKTRQRGIESLISYPFLLSSPAFKRSLLWISHTWHNFRYKEFKQLTDDFSGRQLPSVPRHTISSGLDLLLKNGFGFGINYYYGDKIPLNDANTAYAKSYNLAGAKVSYEKMFNTIGLKISVGGDNLFNSHYSLGNDINGFGGRYYNAAPLRNYYVMVEIKAL